MPIYKKDPFSETISLVYPKPKYDPSDQHLPLLVEKLIGGQVVRKLYNLRIPTVPPTSDLTWLTSAKEHNSFCLDEINNMILSLENIKKDLSDGETTVRLYPKQMAEYDQVYAEYKMGQ